MNVCVYHPGNGVWLEGVRLCRPYTTPPAACLECLTVCKSQKNPEIGAALLSWADTWL